MKKVLFVATITKHINTFHIPYLKYFKEQGYEVHVASNGKETIEYCDKHYNLPFERFPLKRNNLKTYKELKKIINNNQYEIIHCHTPVGGVLTRVAARKVRRKGTKVIYTAHGFHFYKGAPLLNWIIYYPIEKICAKWTDCLITINLEDYEFAKKHLKAKNVEHINGVGMNTERFDIEITENEKINLRKNLNIQKDDIVLSYVAELNNNKNQILLINIVEKLKQQGKQVKLLLVGDGKNKEEYIKIVKEKQLENNVKILGKRRDVPQILSITNIYVASSIREGLGINVIEAMYIGLPIVAKDNRGHRELIKDGKNGYIIKENNVDLFANKILSIIKKTKKGCDFSNNSRICADKYLLKNVFETMREIYNGI